MKLRNLADPCQPIRGTLEGKRRGKKCLKKKTSRKIGGVNRKDDTMGIIGEAYHNAIQRTVKAPNKIQTGASF